MSDKKTTPAAEALEYGRVRAARLWEERIVTTGTAKLMKDELHALLTEAYASGYLDGYANAQEEEHEFLRNAVEKAP